jgi:hypothetical protein
MPNPFAEARQAAHAVYQDALLNAAPPEERLDAALDAHLAALTVAGCVRTPGLQMTGEELDETAQRLAAASRFERYWDPVPPHLSGRWRVLRTSPIDIDIAVAKAVDRGEDPAGLRTDRNVLLAHIVVKEGR